MTDNGPWGNGDSYGAAFGTQVTASPAGWRTRQHLFTVQVWNA